jgi:catechol 2,3-dioxygenase-like lactoylglutathione lyase family enzyme
MTARTGGELPRIPGVRYADHVAFTVPDLDQAVQFFVEALGAQELYRSTRGPDAHFMPENFAVPADARLTLAMLRMPPNLNVELFEWSSADRRTEHPRHSDAGGHHLCFTVADVDQAVAVLRGIPGVRLLGDRKEVAGDSPRVAGNRWIYFLTPWGLLMEIVDRSRVADPPPLVGPADWPAAAHHTAAHDDPRKDQ